MPDFIFNRAHLFLYVIFLIVVGLRLSFALKIGDIFSDESTQFLMTSFHIKNGKTFSKVRKEKKKFKPNLTSLQTELKSYCFGLFL